MAIGFKRGGLASASALSVVASVALALFEIRQAIGEVKANIAQDSIHSFSDAVQAVAQLGDAHFLALMIYLLVLMVPLAIIFIGVVELATGQFSRDWRARAPLSSEVIIEVSTSAGAKSLDLGHPGAVAARLREIGRTLRN